MASYFIGGLGGWWVYRNVSIQADKNKRLIKLPGTRSTLISILLILFSRFFFGYLHSTNPAGFKNGFLIYSDIITSGLIVGFIIGRALYFFYAYRQSRHTNLFKD